MTDLSRFRERLAELYGGKQFYWAPDENIEQAIRCLDSLRDREHRQWAIRAFSSSYKVQISAPEDDPLEGIIERHQLGETLPQAIVSAIAAAKGWE